MTQPTPGHTLLVSPSLDPGAGGIQAYSSFLAEALRAIVGERLECWELVATGEGWEKYGNLLALSLGRPLWKQGLTWVTHLHLLALAAPSTMTKRRAWVTLHGIEVFRDLRARDRLALNRAERILAVSDFTRDEFSRRHPELAHRVVVLPNTFDDTLYSPGDFSPAEVDEFGIDPDDKVILAVGRLASGARHKRFDLLIEAMPRILDAVPNARLVIAGRGDDAPRLKKLAEDHHVSARVNLTGFVLDPQLLALYRRCDVFSLPSTGEGFGIVFLQALGCGKPVVAGNRDGSSQPLLGGELGRLVDPLDPNEIADAIIATLREEQTHQLVEERARRVREHFGREQFRARIEELFAESFSPGGRA